MRVVCMRSGAVPWLRLVELRWLLQGQRGCVEPEGSHRCDVAPGLRLLHSSRLHGEIAEVVALRDLREVIEWRGCVGCGEVEGCDFERWVVDVPWMQGVVS